MTSSSSSRTESHRHERDYAILTHFDDASDLAFDTLPGPQESPVSVVFNDTAYAPR